jgi:EAL domain-containing protein (putative c-di-GMP-specific phosphodiesterase class I)
MTKALGIRANAEGVETNAQATVLCALGCSEAQGYLYSRPISGEAFDEVASTASLGGVERSQMAPQAAAEAMRC